jgi:HEAT repeat protein
VLTSDDLSVRWAAASALVRIGGRGVKSGARYLMETATHHREKNWTDATHIFVAPTGRQALPHLVDAVRNPTLRDFATEMASEASMYLQKDPMVDVKGFLQDNDAGVRCVAAWVLHTARAVELKDVVAVLCETLKATDPWARRQAARFLGKLGRYGKDAAPALAAAMEDKDEGVRDEVAKALKSIQR